MRQLKTVHRLSGAGKTGKTAAACPQVQVYPNTARCKESYFVISRIHDTIVLSSPKAAKAAGHQRGNYDRSSLYVPWSSITRLADYLCLFFTQKRAQTCRRGCPDGLETDVVIQDQTGQCLFSMEMRPRTLEWARLRDQSRNAQMSRA